MLNEEPLRSHGHTVPRCPQYPWGHTVIHVPIVLGPSALCRLHVHATTRSCISCILAEATDAAATAVASVRPDCLIACFVHMYK